MDIQAQAELQQMRDTVQRICAEYGLYGNIYYREASRIPYSDKNRLRTVFVRTSSSAAGSRTRSCFTPTSGPMT